MTLYYTATFSDGLTIKRSTLGRTYTHAWRVGKQTGFSSRKELAEKLAHTTYPYLTDKLREVVPTAGITAKEYRRKA